MFDNDAVSSGLDDAELDRLLRLSDVVDPPPWTSRVEGRDHDSGDTFIMTSRDPDDPNRGEDIYLSRYEQRGDPALYDLVAEARTALPSLIAEIRQRNWTTLTWRLGDNRAVDDDFQIPDRLPGEGDWAWAIRMDAAAKAHAAEVRQARPDIQLWYALEPDSDKFMERPS